MAHKIAQPKSLRESSWLVHCLVPLITGPLVSQEIFHGVPMVASSSNTRTLADIEQKGKETGEAIGR